MDYALDSLPLQWVHPESGVRINHEDMPAELMPTDCDCPTCRVTS